ncbi:MAG TPA: hypothetical protein EYP52_05495 [Anaerolineae bacterium]|nr:hypothetical protein [Anaerolineae bacterium]
MKWKRLLQAGPAALLWLIGCASQPITVTPRPVIIHVVASDTYGPLAGRVASAYHETRPWVRVEVETFNRAVAEERLQAGGAEIGLLAGRDLEGFWSVPFATDGIAVIVHPTVPMEGLALAELREIFRGRIGEWPDGSVIQVVSREDGSGMRALFEEMVMKGSDVTPTALVAADSRWMLETVSSTPGAIGYVAYSRLEGGVRPLPVDGVLPAPSTLPGYPLRYTALVVAPAEPVGEVRAFAQWLLGPEGQTEVLGQLAPPPEE